jgi:hypothetical protein
VLCNERIKPLQSVSIAISCQQQLDVPAFGYKLSYGANRVGLALILVEGGKYRETEGTLAPEQASRDWIRGRRRHLDIPVERLPTICIGSWKECLPQCLPARVHKG